MAEQTASMLAINFQKKGKYKKLDEIHLKLIDDIKSGYTRKQISKKYKEKISRLLSTTSGMNINLVVGDYGGTYVFVPVMNKRHVFHSRYDAMMRNKEMHIGKAEKYYRQLKKEKGWIDNKNAMVGGVFSKVPIKIVVCYIELVQKFRLNYSELTAVVLHELGHGYTWLEHAHMSRTTNLILQDLTEILREKDFDKGKYKSILLESSEKLGLTEKEIDELTNGSNRTILGFKTSKLLIDRISSQMRNGKYAETSSEQSADLFATRHGYGMPLVTGLEKIYRKTSYNTAMEVVMQTSGLAMSAILLSDFIRVIVYIATGAVIPIGAIVIAMFAAFFYLSVNRAKNIDVTYDTNKVRLERIRDQMILLLSTRPDMSDKDKEIIHESIDMMNLAITNTKDKINIFNSIARLLFSKHRKDVLEIELQRDLEKIASNVVIEAASKLDLLSRKTGK